MTIDLLHAIGISVGSLSVGAGIGELVGWYFSDWCWREWSVEDGKAEYYLDENNKRQWRWKT